MPRTPQHSYDRHIASVAGYTTPRIDVRAGIFDNDGRILLVREIADHDRWTIPGGWCDVLESPTEAIEREVLEEAGIHARARQLAALIDREKWPHHPPYDRHIYKLLFVCESAELVDFGF
ncbi:NUDIX domain-containing protein [Dietzia timorensis]|uniref:NUDIX domain-containing protein n=1 Tax=Dietzia timorensis TaxID=499555 RepID=UPI000AA6A866